MTRNCRENDCDDIQNALGWSLNFWHRVSFGKKNLTIQLFVTYKQVPLGKAGIQQKKKRGELFDQ